MGKIKHDDFENILSNIKTKLSRSIEFGEIKSIESNFDTKGVMYKSKLDSLQDGTIIVGEDKERIAVDVSKADGMVISFTMKDIEDEEGLNNVINWFTEAYK